MNRREFVACVAGLTLTGDATGEAVWLEAVVAPRLPQRLAVPASLARGACLFEWRSYADPRVAAAAARLFPGAGIAAHALAGSSGFLIPFESFAAREGAWRIFHSGPEWKNVRDFLDASYQFSIYRTA